MAPRLPLTKQFVTGFSFVAAAILAAAGTCIIMFGQFGGLGAAFDGPAPLIAQTAWGGALGFELAAWMAAAIVFLPPLQGVSSFLRCLLAELRPGPRLVILVGACAGFSEELFFRGALQPLIGLWPAALLFALAHVGVKLDRPRLLFAIYIFAMGALLGLLFEQLGLAAAVAAHAAFDIGFLFFFMALARLRPPHQILEERKG